MAKITILLADSIEKDRSMIKYAVSTFLIFAFHAQATLASHFPACPNESYFTVTGNDNVRYGWFQDATCVFESGPIQTPVSEHPTCPNDSYYTVTGDNGVDYGWFQDATCVVEEFGTLFPSEVNRPIIYNTTNDNRIVRWLTPNGFVGTVFGEKTSLGEIVDIDGAIFESNDEGTITLETDTSSQSLSLSTTEANYTLFRDDNNSLIIRLEVDEQFVEYLIPEEQTAVLTKSNTGTLKKRTLALTTDRDNVPTTDLTITGSLDNVDRISVRAYDETGQFLDFFTPIQDPSRGSSAFTVALPGLSRLEMEIEEFEKRADEAIRALLPLYDILTVSAGEEEFVLEEGSTALNVIAEALERGARSLINIGISENTDKLNNLDDLGFLDAIDTAFESGPLRAALKGLKGFVGLAGSLANVFPVATAIDEWFDVINAQNFDMVALEVVVYTNDGEVIRSTRTELLSPQGPFPGLSITIPMPPLDAPEGDTTTNPVIEGKSCASGIAIDIQFIQDGDDLVPNTVGINRGGDCTIEVENIRRIEGGLGFCESRFGPEVRGQFIDIDIRVTDPSVINVITGGPGESISNVKLHVCRVGDEFLSWRGPEDVVPASVFNAETLTYSSSTSTELYSLPTITEQTIESQTEQPTQEQIVQPDTELTDEQQQEQDVQINSETESTEGQQQDQTEISFEDFFGIGLPFDYSSIAGVWEDSTELVFLDGLPRILEIRADGSTSHWRFTEELFGLNSSEIQSLLQFSDDELLSVGWLQIQINALRTTQLDCWVFEANGQLEHQRDGIVHLLDVNGGRGPVFVILDQSQLVPARSDFQTNRCLAN